MRNSLKDFIKAQENKTELLSEDLISKGYAINQHRAHANNKNKLNSILSRIRSNAQKGFSEKDPEKRFELLFSLFFDLALALKANADMQTNAISVSTAAVLFSEDLQKELKKVFPKVRR